MDSTLTRKGSILLSLPSSFATNPHRVLQACPLPTPLLSPPPTSSTSRARPSWSREEAQALAIPWRPPSFNPERKVSSLSVASTASHLCIDSLEFLLKQSTSPLESKGSSRRLLLLSTLWESLPEDPASPFKPTSRTRLDVTRSLLRSRRRRRSLMFW